MRPEHLHCINTPEGIRRINQEQELYDANSEYWNMIERQKQEQREQERAEYEYQQEQAREEFYAQEYNELPF